MHASKSCRQRAVVQVPYPWGRQVQLAPVPQLTVHPVLHHFLQLCILGVHQTQGCDVGATILELFKVNTVQVQRRDKVAVVVAHHADLLCLLQNIVYPLRGAVQHDVGLGGILDLLQQWPATVGTPANTVLPQTVSTPPKVSTTSSDNTVH